MDGEEAVRIGYRGPQALALILAELIENDDGHVRWSVPPGFHREYAVGVASGLDRETVVGAARLLVSRYPDARVRINGEPIGR
jgi:hypothetical protein